MRHAIPWDFAAVLLVLAVVVPWRGYVRVKQLLRSQIVATPERLILYASTISFQWIFTVFVLWRSRIHGYHPADLGITLGRPGFVLTAAAVLTALITANQLASIRRLATMPRDKQGPFRALSLKLMPQNASERLAFFALVVTVAICEEILYRGWAQRFFQDVAGGSAFFAVIASAALFSVAHIYQGRRGLIATFIVGAVFSVVRAWTGSLLPTMTAHFAADFAAGLLAPVWLNGHSTEPIGKGAAVGGGGSNS
ncbi:MAG TPA: type II CAAX endopeptidase family protein [Candidatus Acidoferrales bacterium]